MSAALQPQALEGLVLPPTSLARFLAGHRMAWMAAQTLNAPASFNQHTLRAAAARHSLASALHWSTVSHRVPRLLEAHIRPPHHEETAAATSHTSGETETQESKVSVRKGPWWSLCLQDSRTGWPTAHFVWLVLK